MTHKKEALEIVGLFIDRFNYHTQPIEQLKENKKNLIGELKSYKYINEFEAKDIIENNDKILDNYISKIETEIEISELEKLKKDDALINIRNLLNGII